MTDLAPGDLSFVFVIEGERLQTQSLILADSLRRHHPNADIIAYLPGGNALDPLVQDFLTLCGVQLRPVKAQEKQWKQPYPHGNKICRWQNHAKPAGQCFSIPTWRH